MSGLEEVRSRPAGELERSGTIGTRKRTRLTFRERLFATANELDRQREKNYDDTAFPGISDGTSKSTAVEALLTGAMR